MKNYKDNFPNKLNDKDFMNLLQKYHNGDLSARDCIITHNLRLVQSICSKYVSWVYYNDEWEDIFSVACIGLIRAIEDFDITKGCQFSTYAGKVVENEIKHYFYEQRKRFWKVSLQEPYHDSKDITMEDMIPSEQPFLEYLLDQYTFLEILQLFSILTDQEKEVISLHLGFFSSPLAYKKIAEQLGVSTSRVGFVYKNAILKLKNAYFNL